MVKASFSKALKMKLVFVFASSVVWAVISVATLVFKVEQHVLGDQLLVDEGDMALFFHEESLGVQNKDIKSDWDQHAAPSRCSSLPKHAIIIPYRDRLEHMVRITLCNELLAFPADLQLCSTAALASIRTNS
jgi:hypothetical protein